MADTSFDVRDHITDQDINDIRNGLSEYNLQRIEDKPRDPWAYSSMTSTATKPPA
jgi:hypothetical protein